jgi:phosphatidylserine decarboxylase
MTMLGLIDDVITKSPAWNDPFGSPGLTFNNILASVVVTPAGFATFCDKNLNAKFKQILDDWGKFTMSHASLKDSVTRDEWLSDQSIFKLSINLPGYDKDHPSIQPFIDAFVKDLSNENWGFTSWDDFFARPFLDINITRPIDPPPIDPPSDDDIITSPCEGRIYGIASNVGDLETFWVKGNRYSLKLLLNNDPDYASSFTGGTVFQAYLSTADYHRWAMPFAGTIKKAVQVSGTYFALPPELVDPTALDSELTSIIEACAYLSIVSARWVVFIEADNPKIGLVCFIAVGLQEVSTVELTVEEGKHYDKGAELGMFHIGGSTMCLVFQPNINTQWEVNLLQHVKIRSKLGRVF